MRSIYTGALVLLLAGGGCGRGQRSSGGGAEPAAAPKTAAVVDEARARPVVSRPGPRRSPAPRTAPRATFAVDKGLDLRVRWGSNRDRRWRNVTYRGSAGDRVTALFRRVRARGRYPAVILGHGHGGDCRSMVQYFGDAFVNQRVHLLAVDHPFHGHHRRVRGQDICAGDPAKLVRRFARAVRDLRHAVRVLRGHPKVDPGRIGYLGFSLGAVLGGLLASHEPRLRAAALISPAGDWPTLARSNSRWKLGWKTELLPRWLAHAGRRRLLATVDPARTIGRFAPRPLVVVVGRRDRVIRPESGVAVHEAAGKGSVLWRHVGGHGPGRRLRRRVAVWLATQLRR